MTTVTTRPVTLTATDLRDWLAEPAGPRLVDVRTPAEFAASHIPGSYNVPLPLLEEHRRELAEHLDDDGAGALGEVRGARRAQQSAAVEHDDALGGALELADAVRPESREAIDALSDVVGSYRAVKVAGGAPAPVAFSVKQRRDSLDD